MTFFVCEVRMTLPSPVLYVMPISQRKLATHAATAQQNPLRNMSQPFFSIKSQDKWWSKSMVTLVRDGRGFSSRNPPA